MSVVYTEIYRKFFDKVKEMTYDMREFISVLSEAFPETAKALHIGRGEEIFKAPVTTININGINERAVFYDDPEGCGAECREFSFRTGEGGSLCIKFYPIKDHSFTEEEISDLEFLSENLFILGGRVQMLNAIRKANVTDMATGAANISGFMSHCGMLAAKNLFTGHVMIFINLKNFKFVNRLIGERQADKVIQGYAQKLMNILCDTEMLARPGGDNFIALVREDHLDQFLGIISNIVFEAARGDETIAVSISARAGVYVIQEGDIPNTAMSACSVALNNSKKSGRHDVVYFSEEMMERTLKANEVSSMFPEALSNKEFVVYYQPKVNLADNTLCGCEALARWMRDGRLVPPADFIPVLEREGTICRLDFYVLERVCSDIRRWIDMGITPVRVSANFSKLHLHNGDFADRIVETINKYGIDPAYVEIELTESSGYEDYEALAEFVKKMKASGICTSIDDFGTGYSSLNLLKDLDVDIIKLDKSFLDNLGNKKKNDEIVIRNIVNMVNELDMSVVAEGVETGVQAELLENISCSMAQGYLFDRPLPCDEFELRLKSGGMYAGKRC